MNDKTGDAKGKRPIRTRYRKPPSIKPSRPRKGEVQRYEKTLLLGKDVAEKVKRVGLSRTDIRTLRQFGFQPTHISHFVDQGRALGLKDDQIGGALKAQIAIMRILRDEYSGRSTEKAVKALKDANGNVSQAIIKKKYSESLMRARKGRGRINPMREVDIYMKSISSTNEIKQRALRDHLINKISTNDMKQRTIEHHLENYTSRCLGLNITYQKSDIPSPLPPPKPEGDTKPREMPSIKPDRNLGKRKPEEVRLASNMLAIGLSSSAAQTIIDFQFKPKDINRFVTRNKASFTNDQIGRALSAHVTLLNVLQNDYCGGSRPEARKVLAKSKFDVTHAIGLKIYEELEKDWRERNPRKSLGTTKVLELYADSLDLAHNLRKSTLQKHLGETTDTSRLKDLRSERPPREKKAGLTDRVGPGQERMIREASARARQRSKMRR